MKINDKIIAREIKGEMVLLNKENGDYFSINEVGTDIFNAISEGKDKKDILDILHQKYKAGIEQLETDYSAFVSRLKNKNIIIEN